MSRSLSRQAEKSENTRKAIMEAAIQCYLEVGYAKTTVMKIAETAGVSRGAMMHHFASRLDIIQASIAYLIERRYEEFRQLLSPGSQPPQDPASVNEESLRSAIKGLWDFFHLPSYLAYQELLVAARTDDDLARIILPAQRELDERITRLIPDMFPVWKNYAATQKVLTDLYHFTLQGIALNQAILDKERIDNLLELLVEQALLEFGKLVSTNH